MFKPHPPWLPGSPTPDSHLIAIEDVKKPQNPFAHFHLASEQCVGFSVQEAASLIINVIH